MSLPRTQNPPYSESSMSILIFIVLQEQSLLQSYWLLSYLQTHQVHDTFAYSGSPHPQCIPFSPFLLILPILKGPACFTPFYSFPDYSNT